MEDNTEVAFNIEWGILIYQLPKEFMTKALRILPNEIAYFFIDEKGLRVYFSRKEIYNKLILKKSINLDGILFYISSTVTCLTVFGIQRFASKETIKSKLENICKCLYDVYQIRETSNYRIILEVPEILANFELKPIVLDEDYECNFPMEFYCRACHREGHKQYQCEKYLTEKKEEGGNGDRCVEDCSKNERNSKQGNFVRNTSSGIDNTRSKGDERSFNSSSRKEAHFTVADPSTSYTPTAVENRKRLNPDSRVNEGIHNRKSQGDERSFNSSCRKEAHFTAAHPSTSSTPTAVENRKRLNPDSRVNEDVRGSTIYSAGTNIRKTLKNTYPSKYIINIIKRTDGILTPNRLLDFLREVFQKKNAIKYAKKYTQNIAELIEQIRNVISLYEFENLGNIIDNKHIKILKVLRNRLESQQVQ